MPNRILRESILDSERVNLLSMPAEVFYRRLMSVVDDYGRFDGRPSVIRCRLYPLRVNDVREADISRWIAECEKAGLIVLYSVDSSQYILFLNLGEPRAKESKYPDPPSELAKLSGRKNSSRGGGVKAEGGTREHMNSRASTCNQTQANVPYSSSYSDSNSISGARDSRGGKPKPKSKLPTADEVRAAEERAEVERRASEAKKRGEDAR